jgi:methyltransferase (TIGR00027 family)
MTLERAGGSRLAASTAEAAAALRAAGARERDQRIRGPDELAARFVASGPRLTALVKIPFVRRLAPKLAERILPGAYWYEIARVRHMDRILCAELSAGARQLVVLGAGFDTRAYRFADRLARVATFEVDHPATAALKRERVRTIFGSLPRHVRYVDADLHAGDLGARLRTAGFSERLRTHLIWSGVTPYLEAHAVDAVLGWLAARVRSGSSIVFDYAFREAVEGGAAFYGAPRLRRRLAEAGEPLLFGIPRGACAGFLAERGLELVSELSPEQLERRYLIRGDGRPAGRPYGFVAIAHARVPYVAAHAA